MAKIKMQVEIIPAFSWLNEPDYRYYVCYGGRGKGASWSFARHHLLRALQTKTRFLMTREIQSSIAASTHRLLEDQINVLGLNKYFNVLNANITCVNGSEFIFEGLYRNINKIKSYEGIDVVDVEEAENVSEDSWDKLLPTIRKDNSKIYVRFNTAYEDDATYLRFVKNKPDNCILRKVNYDQNPYFNDILRQEMEQDKAFRPQIVANKWLGEPLGAGRKVWPTFNESIHVKEFSWDLLKDKGNCYMAMDPASHYYPACIWGAVLPKAGVADLIHNQQQFDIYIYDEWPNRDILGDTFAKTRGTVLFTGSVKDLATQFYIKDGTAEHRLEIKARFIDTRFAKGSGSGTYFSGSTAGIVSEFAKHENGRMIFDCPAEKTIDIQRSIITEAMNWNQLQPLSAINQPRLFIAPWCLNLIESMKFHRLQKDSEAEDGKYKDFSDALRILYAGIATRQYQDPNPPVECTANYAYAGGDGGWMS